MVNWQGTYSDKIIAANRILVVDDHEDTLALMAKFLRQAGYDVVTADGVASAEQVAATGDWDVLVTDLKLHDGTGWDLLNRLRLTRSTPFPAVAVTGLAFPTDREHSLRTGFCAHLTKPIDVPTVLETIKRCIIETPATN